MRGKKIDWTGTVQGKLTIVKEAGKDKWGSILWACKCACGKPVTINSGRLKQGVKSCGCAIADSNRNRAKHNMHNTKIHKAWRSMIHRCHNPNSGIYHRYGGRGITVCKRWRDDFMNFYNDMGDPPTPKHTLDRINNNKGYSPKNCRWATSGEQANNRSTNTWVEYNGKRMTWAQWARYLGIKYNTLMHRRATNKPLSYILSGPRKAGRPKI